MGAWQCLLCLCIIIVVCLGVKTAEDASSDHEEFRLSDVVFVVLSQSNSYHVQRAQTFKTEFMRQVENKSQTDIPEVHISLEKWSTISGGWTVLPLMKVLGKVFKNKKWIFFCEEETRMELDKLIQVLKKYDPKQKLFLGKALRDQRPVIIHHFAFVDDSSSFAYPDFSAGFILSLPLIKRLSKRLENPNIKIDFSIDPKHELAMFIWDEDRGVRLTNIPELCTTKKSSGCATYYPVKFPDCGAPISEEDLFVAVKTCEKFHKDRVPVVKKTWAHEAKHLEFYSDVEDNSIPTISLGIPNTERGHCAKTIAILKKMWTDTGHIPWLLIADDDTIISIYKLRHLLSCYDPSLPVALGERYGYGVSKGFGYDYITGGGGMVFSRAAVGQLVENDRCRCPSDDAPDDMTLGMCLRSLSIPVTHCPYMHQATPKTYADEFLRHQEPISFHKHYMIDPVKEYNKWFKPYLTKRNPQSVPKHNADGQSDKSEQKKEEL